LTDGEIDLIINEKRPANKEKGYVPIYIYKITLYKSLDSIGKISLRVGYNEDLYYYGNIGYEIDESYRGNSYASKACKIIKQVAAAHEMKRLIITCSPDNFPSRRTCEKLGLKLKDIADVPPQNNLYKLGERKKCIYEWNLN
jgi:tagatose 1,6-diphosphate aldolase